MSLLESGAVVDYGVAMSPVLILRFVLKKTNERCSPLTGCRRLESLKRSHAST